MQLAFPLTLVLLPLGAQVLAAATLVQAIVAMAFLKEGLELGVEIVVSLLLVPIAVLFHEELADLKDAVVQL